MDSSSATTTEGNVRRENWGGICNEGAGLIVEVIDRCCMQHVQYERTIPKTREHV